MDVVIHNFVDVELKGATLIDGTPTIGLVSTIAANHLISSLSLRQIAAIDSVEFPSITVIYEGKPQYPARFYTNSDGKLVVLFSEFTPQPRVVRPLANTILNWAREHECARIVTMEGIPLKNSHMEKPEIFCVGSTDRARGEGERAKFKPFTTGVIAGISGVLLNEGRRRGIDVTAMLVGAHPEIPDARGAAELVGGLNRLLGLHVDVTLLKEKGKQMERYIKGVRTQAGQTEKPIPVMYG